MINEYMSNGRPSEALQLFDEMCDGRHVACDEVVYNIALNACVDAEDLGHVMAI
jgi:pentatricopeptide repeat protein